MSEAKQAIEQFKRDLLADMVSKCTDKQRALFSNIYPKVTPANIESAIDLVERTLKKNAADPSRLVDKQP